MFLVWSALYNLLSPEHLSWFTQPRYIIRWLTNGGAGYQLWFLPALFAWTVLALALKRWLGWRVLFAAAGLLYVVGLCLGSYQGVFLRTVHQPLFTAARDGPCFGLILVLIGMGLRDKNFRCSPGAALALLLAGAAGQLGEALLANDFHIVPFYKPDFLLCTIPFGLGAFLLALSVRRQGAMIERLAAAGRLSLGVYAIHLALIQYIAALAMPAWLLPRLLVAAAAFCIATILAAALARVPLLKRLVA